ARQLPRRGRHRHRRSRLRRALAGRDGGAGARLGGTAVTVALTLAQRLSSHLRSHQQLLAPEVPLAVCGRLVRVSGLVMEATGLRLPLGSVCRVRDGERMTEAEVVWFSRGRLHPGPAGVSPGRAPGAVLEARGGLLG